MSEKDFFKVEQDGHIAWLTLNRPDHRNTMGLAFFKELKEHFQRFDKDSSVRGVVIQAKGVASQIAACPPLAVQGAKEAILYSRDHGGNAGLNYVAQKNAASIPREDVMEAMNAFMEKRTPVFKGK